jgi:hypothetical protein
MQASPTVASGGTISSVKATLTYKPSTNATSGTGFWLLVSGDGGGSWTFYPLTAALLSSTTVTSSVDISATINTVSKVQNMRLRFYIESVPGGTGFKTIHDFVHVDVN